MAIDKTPGVTFEELSSDPSHLNKTNIGLKLNT